MELDVFVRDRAPSVRFLGNAYVLPAGRGATMPIQSINTTKAEAVIYRIGDRGLATVPDDVHDLHLRVGQRRQRLDHRDSPQATD